MKVKVTHKTVHFLSTVLRKLGNETRPRFAYAIARNQSRIKNVLEALEKGQKPLPDYQAFNQERLALCEKYADKDENGDPIKRPSPGSRPGEVENFKIVENLEVFEAEMEKLSEKYPTAVEDEEARRNDFVALLDEEVEFEPYKLKMSVCPEGVISGNDMVILLDCDILEWDVEDEDLAPPLASVAPVDEE